MVRYRFKGLWMITLPAADIARHLRCPEDGQTKMLSNRIRHVHLCRFAKGLGNGVELSARVELTPEGESISLQAGSFQPVWNWGAKWVLQRASLIANSVRIVHCANQRNAIREIVFANQNGMPLRR